MIQDPQRSRTAPRAKPGRPGSRTARSPAGPQAVEILVVEPRPVVYEGLRWLLARAGGFRVLGHARTGAEAVYLAELLRPHVAVVEPRLPEAPNGVQLLQALQRAHSSLNVVVFTADEAAGMDTRMLACGAAGFLLKDSPPEVLLHAVRAAASGQGVVIVGRSSSLTLPRVLRAPATGPLDCAGPTLSSREREYLRLLACGLTDVQIASRLRVARSTTRAQLARLYRKLGARSRAHAVARAVVLGVL